MRIKTGIIASNKQQKTVIATVYSYKSHPKYKKRFRVSSRYHIDNPESTKYEIGDSVTFYECRPLSKLKRWTLVKPEAATPKATK
ncbi:MAG: 30S ribosomal protein S17 [Patescibacteria group bacterium]